MVTASPDAAGQTFQGIEPTATLRDADDGTAIASFTPPRLGAETALVIMEIYLRGGAWKARAVGQGYANGLAGIATDFGVSVEEPAAPAAATPAPSAPAADAAAAPADPRVAAPPRRHRPPRPRPRGQRKDQPGQGPGQPPEEPDGVPGQGRPPAALPGQDGPRLGARVPAARTSTWTPR